MQGFEITRRDPDDPTVVVTPGEDGAFSVHWNSDETMYVFSQGGSHTLVFAKPEVADRIADAIRLYRDMRR